MSSISPRPKITLFIVGFIAIGLTMLACSSGSQSSAKVVMLTRLPTLTPTAQGGVVNTPVPIDGAAQAAPAEATAISIDNAAQPAPTEVAAPPPLQPAPAAEAAATPAPVDAANQPASSATPSVVIAALNKVEEYVDLQNVSDQPQDLRGWNILSEKDGQKCNLAGTLAPGETLRIWALATQAAQGGYNCGFSEEIWSDNEPDDAILYDAFGVEVSRAK